MYTFPIQEVLMLAHQAGMAILAEYPCRAKHRMKLDGSPVTSADTQSHHILEAGLRKLTPNIPILSEEACDQFTQKHAPLAPYWLIDPLDGTRDFIHGTDEFTVNIALIDQGQAVRGIVHAPALNTTYFASRGEGAYKQVGDQAPRKLHLPSCSKLPLRIAVSRYHPSETLTDFLNRLPTILSSAESLQKQTELVISVPCGSALKFGWVAESRIDLYPRFGTTSLWDTAAGQCLIEEAGGQVINETGEPLRYLLNHGFKNPNFLAIENPARIDCYLNCIRSLKFPR